MILNPAAAALQEIKSILGSSVILTIIIELQRMLTINSGALVVFTFMVVAVLNTYWMYGDNHDQIEQLSMSSQMTRLFISMSITAIGLIGIASATIGGNEKETMVQKLDTMTQKSLVLQKVFQLVNLTILYSFYRTIINLLWAMMAAWLQLFSLVFSYLIIAIIIFQWRKITQLSVGNVTMI